MAPMHAKSTSCGSRFMTSATIYIQSTRRQEPPETLVRGQYKLCALVSTVHAIKQGYLDLDQHESSKDGSPNQRNQQFHASNEICVVSLHADKLLGLLDLQPIVISRIASLFQMTNSPLLFEMLTGSISPTLIKRRKNRCAFFEIGVVLPLLCSWLDCANAMETYLRIVLHARPKNAPVGSFHCALEHP